MGELPGDIEAGGVGEAGEFAQGVGRLKGIHFRVDDLGEDGAFDTMCVVEFHFAGCQWASTASTMLRASSLETRG